MKLLIAFFAAVFLLAGLLSFLLGAWLLAAVCVIGFLAAVGVSELVRRRAPAASPVAGTARAPVAGRRTVASSDPDIAAYLAAKRGRGPDEPRDEA